MVWFKISTSSGSEDLHCHSYNNKHVIKVVEWSWIKEPIVKIGLARETNSGLLFENPVFCQPIHPPQPPAKADFVVIYTTSLHDFLLCSPHNYYVL